MTTFVVGVVIGFLVGGAFGTLMALLAAMRRGL